jgi:ribosomal protein L32
MRHTKAHTKNRRGHHKVADQNITTDKNSGIPHLRHRASTETGLYRGRQVLDVAKKATKKAGEDKK